MKITKFAPHHPEALTSSLTLGSAAGGDLSGSIPSPSVTGLQGVPISATAPGTGQVLEYNGSEWTPTTPPSLEVKEADGAPDVTGVTQIIVTNGTLTDNGGGSVSITTGGGGGSLEVKEIDGAPDVTGVTVIQVTNGTLTDNGGGNVTIATGGGGSGADANHPMPLDSYAIDGTYGDDFTGASLNTSLWTRRNYTSGAESYQVGKAGTYLRISKAGRSAGDGYFQTAPAGDWTFAMAFIPRFYETSAVAWGLAVVDTNGTGVTTFFYNSPIAEILGTLTTYSSYGGSYVQPGASGSGPNVQIFPVAYWPNDRKVWVYLRKSGTSYYTSFSFDGEVWAPESSGLTWAGTVNRVGMIDGPLGTVTSGTGTGSFVDVDWFNKIA